MHVKEREGERESELVEEAIEERRMIGGRERIDG